MPTLCQAVATPKGGTNDAHFSQYVAFSIVDFLFQRKSSIIVELSAGDSSVSFSCINSRAADANKHVISLDHRQFPTSTVMYDGKTSTEVVHILSVLPIPKSYVGDDHLH